MKLFIDTANVGQVREAWDMGIIGGVTTNPTLIAKEQSGFEATVREIASIVDGPVHAEVIGLDSASMIEEARTIASWGSNMVVKIPITPDGMKAVRILSGEGIKTNVTLVFSPTQAILAAQAGATCVAQYLGRMDDTGTSGLLGMRDITSVFRTHGVSTQVMAASVRSPIHVVEAAKAGADIATLPYAVLIQMMQHPLTGVGIERFLKDWENAF